MLAATYEKGMYLYFLPKLKQALSVCMLKG